MSYQLSDIRTKVQLRIRDTGYSTTEITNYLNDTINDIFNEYRLPFMETTQSYTLTAGDSDITHAGGLPTNFSQAIDLTYTSGGEFLIPYKDYTELDYLYPDEDDTVSHATGKPQYWYTYAQTIKLFPAPDSAYTVRLRYYKKPTALAADADVPPIPSEFEELLVAGAAYRILQVKDNYDQATVFENKYMELLEKLVVKSVQKQVGVPHIMASNRIRVGKLSF